MTDASKKILETGSVIFVATDFPRLLQECDRFVSSRTELDAKTLSTRIADISLGGIARHPLTQESKQLIPEVEILFADPPIISQVLSDPANKVKWAHSTFAGVETFMKDADNLKPRTDFILTRSTSGFGRYMSEYVVGGIIARERHFDKCYESQQQSDFLLHRLEVREYRGLNELSIGILGLGTIGTEVARACKSMGMAVFASIRDERIDSKNSSSSDIVDQFWPMSQLGDMLSQCDYVVSVLPSTPQTRNLLSGEVLKPCQPKQTVFINIGRGDVIDDASLINAVRSGWLGGAILDVFNEEPLPASSPLWKLPGVTITPHVSGSMSHPRNVIQGFKENLDLFLKGETLKNQVDFKKGY